MKAAITEEEMFLGLVLLDPMLFAELYFHEDLSEPPSTKQKMMFLDEGAKRLLCCGRKCAKTVLIETEIIRTGLTLSGEGMFFTPGAAHIVPTRKRITNRVYANRLFRECCDGFNKNEGIMTWRRGAWTWHFRIEGTDGTDRNMVGLRAKRIIGDELAFGTMTCHQSRVQVALPGCRWLYAGVPNAWHQGVLFSLDQTSLGDEWSRHRLTTYDNPIYRNSEAELIEAYKGKDTREYQTQVLGKWGEELSRSFPPGAIAIDPSLPIANASYQGNIVAAMIEDFAKMLRVPKVNADNYIMGVDYGYSPDPAEIIVFYEREPDVWCELLRYRLAAVIASHQGILIHTINEVLGMKLKAIGIEFVGGGMGVVQELTRTDTTRALGAAAPYAQMCVNSNPGGTIEVAVIEAAPITEVAKGIEIPDFGEGLDTGGEAGVVKMYRKLWMTIMLRDAMIRANQGLEGLKVWLGQDDYLVESIMNVLEKRTVNGNTVYDKIDRNVPDHPVDAARSAMAAIHHFKMSRASTEDNSLDVYAFGWANTGQPAGSWRSPYQ